MIEEVVNSILEAEDVAAQRIAAAKQEAGEIVSAAEIDAENFKKQAAAANKEHFLEKSKQIEQASLGDADKSLAELNAQTDKEIANYGKHTDAAVKVILEQLL